MIDAEILRTSPHGPVIREILAAAMAAVDPRRAVREAIESQEAGRLRVGPHQLCVADAGRIRVVGAGKAVEAMAWGAVDALGQRLDSGMVIGKGDGRSPEIGAIGRIIVDRGDHPVPGAASVGASAALRRWLADARAEDLVLCLVSGGASALLCDPRVDLVDLQETTRVLLRHDVPIQDINCVRRGIDRLKAGGLASAAAPARVLGLIVSDVLGDDPRDIGSGPTVPFEAGEHGDAGLAALACLEGHGLTRSVPRAVLDVLSTPRDPQAPPRVIDNLIVARNRDACEGARACATRHGYLAAIDAAPLTGEARKVGETLARRLLAAPASSTPSCVILGGETTVEVKGSGRGGRNQELALAAARVLDGSRGCLLVAFASDGEDGSTPCAGAIVDGSTVARARAAGIDAARLLDDNDSHRFFTAIGDALLGALRVTNVGDLVLLLRLAEEATHPRWPESSLPW